MATASVAGDRKEREQRLPPEDERLRARGRKLVALYWDWVEQGRPVRAGERERASA